MGTVILDSCVMLGMMDPTDALHEASARAVRDRHREDFVVPASVFAEVLVAATREGAKVVRAYEEMIDDIAREVRPIDRETAKAAAAIRAKHKAIRLPDALVLATGHMLDAEVLTAYQKWSRVDRRVTILKPALNLLPREANPAHRPFGTMLWWLGGHQ